MAVFRIVYSRSPFYTGSRTYTMFNHDINDIKRNWLIAAVVLSISIPVAVAFYSMSMILTTARIEFVKEKYEYLIEISKTAGVFIGGIAVFSNAFFAGRSAEAANKNAEAANKNANVANQKHITERFAKAMEQLGSEKIEVKLGAIYTLEGIAEDSEKDQWTIMEILTAFVRKNAPIKEEDHLQYQDQENIQKLPKLGLDIQACLTIIGDRKYPDPLYKRLDLTDVNISKANLTEANLKKANLIKVNLIGADLIGANLSGAYLIGANLSGANLFIANLTGADLSKADLTGAYLRQADLSKADLTGAYRFEPDLITKVQLTEADLAGAILKGAIMPDESIHD
jgi:hypothetical protein